MDEHVTQGRTITLVPHTPLETPRRPFSNGIAELAILQLSSNRRAHRPIPSRSTALFRLSRVLDLRPIDDIDPYDVDWLYYKYSCMEDD